MYQESTKEIKETLSISTNKQDSDEDETVRNGLEKTRAEPVANGYRFLYDHKISEQLAGRTKMAAKFQLWRGQA